jgi:hypothetical protein
MNPDFDLTRDFVEKENFSRLIIEFKQQSTDIQQFLYDDTTQEGLSTGRQDSLDNWFERYTDTENTKCSLKYDSIISLPASLRQNILRTT